ncbi:MAG: magnesium and cobalt transporter [Ascidiaceihabitans sp.]|jgi:magnesium and cobalt transporter
MGDSIDGSSDAARRAQSDNEPHSGSSSTAHNDAVQDVLSSDTTANSADVPEKTGGFLSRVIGALSPADVGEPTLNEPKSAPQKYAHGMINLSRMRVDDVAVPKFDIIAVGQNISKDELVAVFKDTGLTRLPVYNGTLDTPIGLIHLKDFALTHGFNGGGQDYDLTAMLRPLLFVPPSMTIGVLLTKMQAERRHMALVIDEYGGVDGLVTIEDLIEQVIGEIEDEHDVDEGKYWSIEPSGCYLAVSKTPLIAFEAEIGQSLTDHEDVDEEEIDTLGGLVFMLAGRVPARGEVVPHPDGPEFEVIDADPRRIKRLRVRLGS